MASLSADISQSCTAGAGVLTLTRAEATAGTPSADAVYAWSIIGADGVDHGGTFDPALLPISASGLPNDTYAVRVRAQDGADLYLSPPYSFTLSCATTSGGGTGGGSTGPTGCTTSRALNYDPTATQDSTPSACVFVQVTVAPGNLVAAHLPIPVAVRASPTAAGLASIVVLRLETATTPAGPWTEFGRLRQVCDATATARFNLSEAAKGLLRIAPPVESGVDPNLSALLRVRYEVLDPVALTPSYSGTVGTCRALNAVLAPVAGAVLTTPTVYDALPTGGAQWETTATLAAGVVSTLLDLPASGCTARQFAWLNPAGAWDTGFFTGRHGHGTDQADPRTFRDGAGAARYTTRGTVRDTLQVYSDKLSYAAYLALRGVRKSVQVYERTGPGQYVPVLVSSESYPEFQETDKTFQVNFTVSYPAQLIQTQ